MNVKRKCNSLHFIEKMLRMFQIDLISPHLFCLDGVGLKGVHVIGSVLDHDQRVVAYFQMVQLPREYRREYSLLILQLELVLSVDFIDTEEEEQTRDLQAQALGSTPGEHCDLVVGHCNTTLHVKSVYAVLLQRHFECPFHIV